MLSSARTGMARIPLLAAMIAAAVASEPTCSPGSPLPNATRGQLLLQKQSMVQRAAGLESTSKEVNSDCSQRLGRRSTQSAACVVINDGKVMLVWVPYGKQGWDLPGGYSDGSEPDCETAERGVCEETHHEARAVQNIGGNVFRCELGSGNACKGQVDEGLLRFAWFRLEDLDTLSFRDGDTGGDKKRVLRDQLQQGTPPTSLPSPAPTSLPPPVTLPTPSLPPPVGAPPNGQFDACCCRVGREGWSTTIRQCRSSSQTSPEEAAVCHRARNGQSGEFDVCGCRIGQEGWSTTVRQCRSGSWTSPEETAACRNCRAAR